MAKLRNEVLSCITTPELQRKPSTKLLSRFQTRGCVAQSRVSSSQTCALKPQTYSKLLEVFEIHKLTPNLRSSWCKIIRLKVAHTLISKSKVALLRFLQVFEIHKLTLGHFWGGDPKKVGEPMKKWPFHKKNSQFLGLLSFSNFCTQNQICLKASNSRSGSPQH